MAYPHFRSNYPLSPVPCKVCNMPAFPKSHPPKRQPAVSEFFQQFSPVTAAQLPLHQDLPGWGDGREKVFALCELPKCSESPHPETLNCADARCADKLPEHHVEPAGAGYLKPIEWKISWSWTNTILHS